MNAKKYIIRGAAYIIIAAFVVSCQYNSVQQSNNNKIVIWLHLSAKLAHPEPANYILKENMELSYLPIKNMQKDQKWQSVNAMASNGYVKWIFYSDEPVKIKYGFGILPIINPGDSIVIRYNGEEYEYAGKGANKITCWNTIGKVGNNLKTPTSSNNFIKSLNDYLQWNSYVNNKLSLQIPLLDSVRSKITPFEYDYLKTMFVSQAESDRIQTFQSLKMQIEKDSSLHASLPDLNNIWDSTQYHPLNNWLQSLSDYYGEIRSINDFNKVEVWRQFGFDSNKDSLKSKELRNYLYYTHTKEKYKGLLRERLLADILAEQTKKGIKEPITQLMLKDYYSQPGFPEFKKRVKEVEDKLMEKLAKN